MSSLEDLLSIRKMVVSISGKGGSGKTTLCALLLKTLVRNAHTSILVVDADPATNLPEVLGVEIGKTVGMVAGELRKKIDRGAVPVGQSKADLLETWVFGTLVETPGFDLLPMGRTEGEGCYCYVNSVLTRILDVLTKNYDITLMDMEAGLEHLSRRTDRNVDILFVVTDPSRMGLETAKRIRDLVKEVHIEVKKIYLIGNQFPETMESLLVEHAQDIGVDYGGILPADATISRYNLEGKPLLAMPWDNPAVRAAQSIAQRTGLSPATNDKPGRR